MEFSIKRSRHPFLPSADEGQRDEGRRAGERVTSSLSEGKSIAKKKGAVDCSLISRSMRPVESTRLVCSGAKARWEAAITDEWEERAGRWISGRMKKQRAPGLLDRSRGRPVAIRLGALLSERWFSRAKVDREGDAKTFPGGGRRDGNGDDGRREPFRVAGPIFRGIIIFAFPSHLAHVAHASSIVT